MEKPTFEFIDLTYESKKQNMKKLYVAGENIAKDKLVTVNESYRLVFKATPFEIAEYEKSIKNVSEVSTVEDKWLIYSLEHNGWWLPAECGYTLDKSKAGVYTYERACEIVESANIQNLDVPNEAMIKLC